jgi:hypothetical protein
MIAPTEDLDIRVKNFETSAHITNLPPSPIALKTAEMAAGTADCLR